jgi:hypothetical protein
MMANLVEGEAPSEPGLSAALLRDIIPYVMGDYRIVLPRDSVAHPV